jgi:hypothetical protein
MMVQRSLLSQFGFGYYMVQRSLYDLSFEPSCSSHLLLHGSKEPSPNPNLQFGALIKLNIALNKLLGGDVML